MKINFSFIKKKIINLTNFINIKNVMTNIIILTIIMIIFCSKKWIEPFITPPNTNKKLDPNTTTNNRTYKATTWKPETLYNYLLTQKTNNENVIYDPIILQQNATQEEAEYFLKNGYWYWSEKTKREYIDKLNKNTIVRTFPKQSLEIYQKIYPEKTIQEILYFNSPEGEFVLEDTIYNENQNKEKAHNKGMGIFGFTSGLLNEESNQRIGCRKLKGDQTSEPYLIIPSKGTYSQVLPKAKKLDYSQIPELINGFQYMNETCNPCSFPPVNLCKFKINKT